MSISISYSVIYGSENELKKSHLSRSTTKPTKWPVRPAKTHVSLDIHPVWPESSLSAWRNIGSLAAQWAHSEDSDHTGGCPGWSVFAGRTGHIVDFVMLRLIYLLPSVGSETKHNLDIFSDYWRCVSSGSIWMLSRCNEQTIMHGTIPVSSTKSFNKEFQRWRIIRSCQTQKAIVLNSFSSLSTIWCKISSWVTALLRHEILDK